MRIQQKKKYHILTSIFIHFIDIQFKLGPKYLFQDQFFDDLFDQFFQIAFREIEKSRMKFAEAKINYIEVQELV